MVAPLVDRLIALRPTAIIHSDMVRTRAVAMPLAARLGITPVAEPLWRERHFGTWEGRGWNAIYRATGSAMDGMTDAPDTFRPGGNGETTRELFERTAAALAATACEGTLVVITHGGPIACARARQLQEEIALLANLVPPAGSITILAGAR